MLSQQTEGHPDVNWPDQQNQRNDDQTDQEMMDDVSTEQYQNHHYDAGCRGS